MAQFKQGQKCVSPLTAVHIRHTPEGARLCLSKEAGDNKPKTGDT